MSTIRWGSRSRELILLLSIGCGLVQAKGAWAVTVSAGNATGSPGQTVTIPISLDNDVAVRAVQFRLTDVPDVLDLAAARTTARSAALIPGADEQVDGSVIGLLLSLGTALIAPGTGAVMELDFTIAPGACSSGGTVTLHLSEVAVADANRNPLPVDTQDGSVALLCVPTPTFTPTRTGTPTPTATITPTRPAPTCAPGDCWLDVDCRNGFDVATDAVYMARVRLGLPAVPSSFRALDPTIPSDAEIEARVRGMCPGGMPGGG